MVSVPLCGPQGEDQRAMRGGAVCTRRSMLPTPPAHTARAAAPSKSQLHLCCDCCSACCSPRAAGNMPSYSRCACACRRRRRTAAAARPALFLCPAPGPALCIEHLWLPQPPGAALGPANARVLASPSGPADHSRGRCCRGFCSPLALANILHVSRIDCTLPQACPGPPCARSIATPALLVSAALLGAAIGVVDLSSDAWSRQPAQPLATWPSPRRG